MLTALTYTVDLSILREAANSLSNEPFKLSINQPTGSFFYDPWIIKPEFANTVWARILATLSGPVGEARIIVLKPATNYQSHADIDDRYHLNITGEHCFLIDIENKVLHNQECNGIWQSMDAGLVHSAANFGRHDRAQLVVRQLLTPSVLTDPVAVEILSNIAGKDDTRFIFDNTISPWLNRANKLGIINNFYVKDSIVNFNLQASHIKELEKAAGKNFRIKT